MSQLKPILYRKNGILVGHSGNPITMQDVAKALAEMETTLGRRLTDRELNHVLAGWPSGGRSYMQPDYVAPADPLYTPEELAQARAENQSKTYPLPCTPPPPKDDA